MREERILALVAGGRWGVPGLPRFAILRPSTTTTISFPASENFTSTFFIVMRSFHTLIAKLDAGWEKAKRSPGDGGTSRGFSGSFWGNLVMGGREIAHHCDINRTVWPKINTGRMARNDVGSDHRMGRLE